MTQGVSSAWACQKKVPSGVDNGDNSEDGKGSTTLPPALEFTFSNSSPAGVIQCVQKRGLGIYSPIHRQTDRQTDRHTHTHTGFQEVFIRICHVRDGHYIYILSCTSRAYVHVGIKKVIILTPQACTPTFIRYTHRLLGIQFNYRIRCSFWYPVEKLHMADNYN